MGLRLRLRLRSRNMQGRGDGEGEQGQEKGNWREGLDWTLAGVLECGVGDTWRVLVLALRWGVESSWFI